MAEATVCTILSDSAVCHFLRGELFAKTEVHIGSVRPISRESWIRREPCNEGHESWWIFRRLACQAALQQQMFVPIAEATKAVLFVASENVGI